jgi:hypothetical protein
MNKNKAYIILVLSCKAPPYDMLEQSQRDTWAKDSSIDTVFYYGDPTRETHWEGDRLFLKTEESVRNVDKSILAYEEVLKAYPDVQHIFLTNASAYVRIDKIKEVFESLPKEKVYSGKIMDVGIGITFASGSGFFLSRDMAESLVKNKSKLSCDLLGDVCLAVYFHSLKVPIIPQPSYWAIDEWSDSVNLIYDNIKDHFHFRCKHEHNRNGDVLTMKRLYGIFNNEKIR